MIKKIKIKNYKCIVDLEMDFSTTPTALLVGKNAVGKSVLGDVLALFQAIGQRRVHTRDLIHEKDFSFGNKVDNVYLSIAVEINSYLYEYDISFEWPLGFQSARVCSEKLSQDGMVIFSRDRADVDFKGHFSMDWHFAALPMLGIEPTSPTSAFRTWLARIVVIAPIPSLMSGVSTKEPVGLHRDGSNFADWFVNILTRFPAVYRVVEKNLKSVFLDFDQLELRPFNENSKKIRLMMRFGVLAPSAKVCRMEPVVKGVEDSDAAGEDSRLDGRWALLRHAA